MKRYQVTIIGMGPRGLSVLERIAALARRHRLALDLQLVEPGECGQGAHPARQPSHLLINTVASQVTAFPAPGVVDDGPLCATPSLTEWARQRGYRRVARQRYECLAGARAEIGAEIGDGDYLPRALLGQYLSWAYEQLVASLPPQVSLRHHRQRAFDLWRQPDGRCAVALDSGYILPSDFVFLTTGHCRNAPSEYDAWCAGFVREQAPRNSRLDYVRHVYPLEQLVRINDDARVGIQGMGLSAHDVIAELTVGRGGAFEHDGAGLCYRRSGREPQLLLFSRHCLPYAARGRNQKGLAGRHRARHFTPEAIAALRQVALRQRGSGQLDFEAELMPLLLSEMADAYRGALDGSAPERPSAADTAAMEALLFPLRGRQFSTLAQFRQFYLRWLRSDLAQAERGNVDSPVKAATDVLRDVRAGLQAAIEHGGLTPASHRHFLKVVNPAINRVSFGPPRHRNEELLALFEAGVVELACAPQASLGVDEAGARFVLQRRHEGWRERCAFDVLVSARLDVFYPELDQAPLMRNLLRRGLVRPYHNGGFHPGGIDIDRGGQPLDAGGRALASVWALGYPVEGAHYYTHALPRPLLSSRQVLDADRCVKAMCAAIAAAETVAPVAEPAQPAVL